MNTQPDPSQPIVIIGGGYTGLAAAWDLAHHGHKVIILEQDKTLGGLAGSFELSPGNWIEKFYHHWFTSDTAILDLVKEIGLESQVQFLSSNTGLFFANSIFRLASPLDLLRFTPLPLIDRIRTGVMALIARRIDDWRSLENQSAEEWIRKVGGNRAFEVIWKPLLLGKFGPEAGNVSAVWFWNKLKLRGSSRNSKGGESLAYIKGGFKKVTETLVARIREQGVQIRTSTRVIKIISENGVVKGVETAEGLIHAKAVLATVPLPVFLDIAPQLPPSYTESAKQIRFLGNVCLVLRLRKSLSSTYWLNVADPTFPFVGIIEHTNFDDKSNYGGEHIAYMSKYLPTSDPMYQFDEKQLFEYCLPHIQRMFPGFSADEWVIGYRAWKAEFSQPVITKHYSTLIPATKTPIGNVWLSTMAQIYPEDRGTNYAVRHARQVAREMIKTLEQK